MKIYSIITAIFMSLVIIPVVYGTELTNTWINIDDTRTRIVFQFDKPVEYQFQYTHESRLLSLYFPKSNLGNINKVMNIDSDMVGIVTLRDVLENMVIVNIHLKDKNYFNVIPLEIPNQIAVDIMKEKIPVVFAQNTKVLDTPKDAIKPEVENITKASINKDEKSHLSARVLPIFMSMDNELMQIYYDIIQTFLCILLVSGLIYMRFKLKRLYSMIENSPDYLKKKKSFADIIDIPKKGKGKSGGKNKKMDIVNNFEKDNPYQGKYKKILKLAKLGIDRFEISKRSNIPIGEVNLILDIYKSKAKG
ncbi:hypothetical protein GF312_21570 [Candidatus Poribacteria bacterium]|nr:hypothetical protein [Candidatus Poribacteria bacterium]